MPRNGSGTYSLPTGNPVEAGTTIEANWANTTLSDIGNELTNSLSRNGNGGMLAPFRLADGTVSSPGVSWLNEPSTGFYRASAGVMWGVVSGQQVVRYTSAGIFIPTGKPIAYGNVEENRAALKAVAYTETTGSAVLPKGTTAERDAVPTSGLIRYNTDLNILEVFDGASWNTMQNTSVSVQTFSGDALDTDFTLAAAPVSLQSVAVFISGVRQYPTTDYTVSGTTLTFTTAPPTGTDNILVQWLSALSTTVPADGSVGTAQLAPTLDYGSIV